MRIVLAAVLCLLLAAPAAGAQGADHVASDGVELIANVRLPGAGMGASLHGNRLFVTSPSHLSIFDVAEPEAPELTAIVSLGAANETEDVATNGRVAAVAEGTCLDPAAGGGGCVAIFDVDDPTGVRRVASLPMNAATAACVLDCRYLWVGGANAIVDIADPAAPTVVGEFAGEEFCYIARELRPGVVVASCDPVTIVLSTRAEDGGSPVNPARLATAPMRNYSPFAVGPVPHSARWPRGGTDAFMLTTTETPFQRECSEDIGSVVLWDARPVLAGGELFESLAEWRPANGTYADGRSPYNAVGCSPHFGAEHPTFRDGGLFAQAALDNGLRLLQVTPSGTIEERGWFLGLGGVAAVPVWHPDGRVLYVADYARGLDVIRYSGDTYVPPASDPGPAGPPPSSTREPAPRFRNLGVIRRTRRAATIAFEAPSPGRFRITGRGAGRRLKPVKVRVGQAGVVTATVGLRGRLPRRPAVLSLRARWMPEAGRAQTLRFSVRLAKR